MKYLPTLLIILFLSFAFPEEVFPMPVKVGLVQVASKQFEVEYNYDRTEKLIRKAAAGGASLIITPECVLNGYSAAWKGRPDYRTNLSKVRALAEPIPGPHSDRVAALAKDLGVYIVFGMPEADPGGRMFNTAILAAPDGSIAGKYRKVHLRPFEMETGYSRGEEFKVYDIEPGGVPLKLGIMICFDREIVESARVLRVLGADVIAIPLATSAGKDDLWRWETRMRAFENEVYLVMVNHAAPRIDGGSLLIDPLGDLKLLAGPEEEVFYGTIDPDRIREVREQTPNDNFSLDHRNPAAYGPLNR
ncbi:carbon-nitrogen hydrolase family protein [candidate division KSB1 bacterium]